MFFCFFLLKRKREKETVLFLTTRAKTKTRFQEEKEIVAMMDLRMAYEGNDLAKFERTLHDKRNRITDDPFVMTYLDPLRRRIRESVLLHLTRPYQKITMAFMAGVSKLSTISFTTAAF